MSAPEKIIVAPFTIYLAPTGSTFPVINVAPASPWVILGSSGARDYDEDGVTVTHEQTIDIHRMLGATGPIKATRSEEGLMVGFTLHDMTLEQYAVALSQTVVTTAGPPATKEIPLYRGFEVAQFSLLVRGASPYGAFNMQYEVPVVINQSEAAPTFNKTDPAGLEFEFYALEDPNAASDAARFGRLIAGTA